MNMIKRTNNYLASVAMTLLLVMLSSVGAWAQSEVVSIGNTDRSDGSLPYPSSFKTTCGLGSCWSLPSLLPFHSSFRDICSVVMSETKDSCYNNSNVD